MRYCVPCGSDYLDDPPYCPSCDSRTLTPEELELWRAARDELTGEHFAVAAVLDGPVEANWVQEVFDEEGIPYIVHAHGADGFGMIFHEQSGWGVLRVPQDDLDRARRLVRALRSDADRRWPRGSGPK